MAYTWSKTLATVEAHDGGDRPLNDVYNRRQLEDAVEQRSAARVRHRLQLSGAQAQSNKAVEELLLAAGRSAAFCGMRAVCRFAFRTRRARSNSLVFRGGTNANRVPGEPLFLKDPNCGCFDPNKEFMLNPAAWTDPGPGQWGTAAAYYSDYRTRGGPTSR